MSFGGFIFDYNSCLFIAFISCILSLVFLLLFKKENVHRKDKGIVFLRSLKRLIKSKSNNWFYASQLLAYISYGIVFDLMLLILTGYVHFDVSFASIFIIICNALGSIVCSIFNRFSKNYSVCKSAWIKFGIRSLGYFLAFLTNNIYVIVLAIIIAHITSRILEDKVIGVFINRIKSEDRFLSENIRYFVVCIGEGIGTLLAGILLSVSFRALFLGASLITLIQIFIIIKSDKINKNV